MSVTAASSQSVAIGSSVALPLASQSITLRVALVLGCIASVVLTLWVGRPEHFLESDLELARLLRGMAIIKSVIVLAGVGLLVWRFGRPVSARLAGVYLVGAWLVAGASMLIWQLTFIPLAAAVFHVGELSLLVAAWFDCKSPARRNAA